MHNLHIPLTRRGSPCAARAARPQSRRRCDYSHPILISVTTPYSHRSHTSAWPYSYRSNSSLEPRRPRRVTAVSKGVRLFTPHAHPMRILYQSQSQCDYSRPMRSAPHASLRRGDLFTPRSHRSRRRCIARAGFTTCRCFCFHMHGVYMRGMVVYVRRDRTNAQFAQCDHVREYQPTTRL